MSLFGSYIQESVEVVEESYYTDYDYFTEALNTTFDEFSQFHQFLEEKVDVKAGGAKIWSMIVGAVKKLIKMLQDLMAKIRSIVGDLLTNVKAAKSRVDAIRAAKAKINNDAKAKEKTLKELQSAEIWDMSDAFEKAVNNVEPVEKLGVSIGVDGFKKGVAGKELVNNNAIAVFKITDELTDCITKKKCDSVDQLAAEAEKAYSKLQVMVNKLKEFDGYAKKAEATAKKFESFAEKYQSQGLKMTSNNDDDEKLNKGTDFMLASEAAKKDVQLLSAYAAGITKMTNILRAIALNNAKFIKKVWMVFGATSGSAKAEGEEKKEA